MARMTHTTNSPNFRRRRRARSLSPAALRRRRRFAGTLGAIAVTGSVAVLALASSPASAFKYPDAAEARLTLDGTQSAPHDGFNMRIDTNGFTAPGGDVIDTRMFCINATLQFRCGIADDLVRVQAEPSAASLTAGEANQLAWLLTNRDGYTDEEVQHAIWCVTDPGVQPAVGNSDQLCQDSAAFAAPVVSVLSLTTLGAGTVDDGQQVHFELTTNAPRVQLSVDDGGSGPSLCGTAPDNAHATIDAGALVQTEPVATRTFELCLTRTGIGSGSADVTLSAVLDATVANLQVWVHPQGANSCQAVIEAVVTTERISANASGTWNALPGALTIRKTMFGDFPQGTTFTVRVDGQDTSVEHTFPDRDGDPYEHTFVGLAPGTYTVTETDTGGATSVEITGGGTVVLGSGGATVDVVNVNLGNLVLAKRTDRATTAVFEFRVVCRFHGRLVGGWSNPVRLRSGQEFDTGPLPAGSECDITETDSAGAATVTHRVIAAGSTSSGSGTAVDDVPITGNDTSRVEFVNSLPATTTSSVPVSTVPGTATTDDTIVVGGTTATSIGGTKPGKLPSTGMHTLVIVWIAITVAGAGGLLVVASRRRRAGRTT
jgi:LPXTG-motif cell wall-anchored protein